MAFAIADRVREQVSSFAGGTGAVTLPVSAVSGFQTFLSGWGASGTGYYCLVIGAQWETGLGTLNAGGTTLTRTDGGVYASSGGAGARVNFSAGTMDCFGTMPASRMLSVNGAGNVTIDAVGTGTIVLGGTSTGGITLGRATTLSAALTYGGVTLSNAVTGTGNIALSASPTFTGTVTAAGLTTSGTLTFGGGPVVINILGAAQMRAATDQNLYIRTPVNLSDGIVLQSTNDINSALKGMEWRASAYRFDATGSVTVGTDLVIGAPTGGAKGTGTVNATAVYDDNVLLTCPALAEEFIKSGKIDIDKWDALVPDRVIPAQPEHFEERAVMESTEDYRVDLLRQDDGTYLQVKTADPIMRQVKVWTPIYDEHGNGVDAIHEPVVERVVHPAVGEIREPRRHEVAHLFVAMVEQGFDPRDPVAYIARLKKDQALPGMPNQADWVHASHSVGEIHNRLWLATEMLALAFIGLHERVAKLEK